MTFKKAKELLTIDIDKLDLLKLQKHRVNLIDAWRYAKGDYGFDNDFFLPTPELRAYTPRDFWLLQNIEFSLDAVFKKENQ